MFVLKSAIDLELCNWRCHHIYWTNLKYPLCSFFGFTQGVNWFNLKYDAGPFSVICWTTFIKFISGTFGFRAKWMGLGTEHKKHIYRVGKNKGNKGKLTSYCFFFNWKSPTFLTLYFTLLVTDLNWIVTDPASFDCELTSGLVHRSEASSASFPYERFISVISVTSSYSDMMLPSLVTFSAADMALPLRSLTMLSTVASWRRKIGRTTRLYNTWEPFQATGAIHHSRNRHWGDTGQRETEGDIERERGTERDRERHREREVQRGTERERALLFSHCIRHTLMVPKPREDLFTAVASHQLSSHRGSFMW